MYSVARAHRTERVCALAMKSLPITKQRRVYVHLRWTMLGPLSSYSSFLIHISSKVLSEDRMEPPIHTEYLRSGGAMILIVIESGAKAFTSFCTLSGMLLYIVVPPDITMFPYRSFLMSTSHFMIDEKVSLWMPPAPSPKTEAGTEPPEHGTSPHR